MIFLGPAFFVTAMLYAMVGFGGGSTYSALLALSGTDYRILPAIALICNLIVVSGGTYRFARADQLQIKRMTPWITASVPAAWLGGYIAVSERFFIGLLGLSLLLAGAQILVMQPKERAILPQAPTKPPVILPGVLGAGLGFLAGVVGIGGGIFLAPVLYLIRWGEARAIAAACSLFILVNSLAGLAGQLMKLESTELLSHIGSYWLLFPAVLIGGQIGSYMGATYVEPKVLKALTGVLILYVAFRLIWRWWGMG